jgi:hypothetical protein
LSISPRLQQVLFLFQQSTPTNSIPLHISLFVVPLIFFACADCCPSFTGAAQISRSIHPHAPRLRRSNEL